MRADRNCIYCWGRGWIYDNATTIRWGCPCWSNGGMECIR